MDDAALTVLLCEQLGRIPKWAWRPDPEDLYLESEVAVFYGSIDPTPDRACGVRVYGTIDARDDHYGARRVQLRLRGARGQARGADLLAWPAFLVMQNLSRVGGISGASRQSMTPLGADDNGREERTENYLILLDNTEASTS